MLLPALLSSLALAAPDTAAYQAVLDAHLSRGRVDYGAVKASGALDGYLAGLETAAEPAGRAEKMAFWINAYNALTIDLIADEWPVSSIMDLDGGKVWDTRSFTVAGRSVTLNAIEHQILRPMGDARIHAAVNCASIGCPPLYPKAFTGAGLEGQLAAASRAWMQTNGVKVDPAGKQVTLSKIFEWYGDDFVPRADTDVPGLDGKREAAVDFAADHLPAETAAFLRSGGYSLGYHAYDWKVNGQ